MDVQRVYIRISKSHGFKPPILKEIVFLRGRGFNNLEIAEETGISRNTVASYIEKMREMQETEVAELMSLVAMLEAHNRRRMAQMLKELE
jgi:DNA-binding NarL/FixJ family response regulator